MLEKNKAPTEPLYSSLLKKIAFRMDKAFLEFFKNHNGAEGSVGENGFLLIWNINDLIALNPYYEGEAECERLFFFGSNGSDFGYALEKETGKVVGVCFLDIGQEQPEMMAESFETFLKGLET
jgi:hypothetical protein